MEKEINDFCEHRLDECVVGRSHSIVTQLHTRRATSCLSTATTHVSICKRF